jgi:hypothetical protein
MRIKITFLSLLILFMTMNVMCSTESLLSCQEIITNVMNYPMTDMVFRCQKDFGYSDEDMIILERECKRYLILCYVKDNPDDGIAMYSADVDNMWHSFILFTKEYADFCQSNFGHFIHHEPNRVGQDESLSLEHREKNYYEFCDFVELYEKIFEEEIHDVWLLDRCEKIRVQE